MRRIALVLALAAALAVAGCLGGGGDGADTASTPGTTPTGEDAPDNDTAGNDTADEPVPRWNTTSFEGEASGPNLVFVFTPGPTHNVTVLEDTRNLTVNATSSDGELLVDVYPPGCEEQDNQRGEDCSHTADTQGDDGQWTTEDPEPGTWTIRVSKADPGTGSTSYEVTADRLELVDPSSS